MKNILICMLAVVVVTFSLTGAWAAKTQTVNVNAVVPTIAGGITLKIYKVTGTTFTPATSINFGSLVWNQAYNHFETDGGFHYAVDVSVIQNTGVNWTLTHTRQSLKKDATNNLDSHVNVAFNQVVKSDDGKTDIDTNLQKVSFADSNGIAYTKTQLGQGGWLRLYYGIGGADPKQPDASGVTPIDFDSPAGTYTGSVTITLTP